VLRTSDTGTRGGILPGNQVAIAFDMVGFIFTLNLGEFIAFWNSIAISQPVY
jgi:hypothetical protein